MVEPIEPSSNSEGLSLSSFRRPRHTSSGESAPRSEQLNQRHPIAAREAGNRVLSDHLFGGRVHMEMLNQTPSPPASLAVSTPRRPEVFLWPHCIEICWKERPWRDRRTQTNHEGREAGTLRAPNVFWALATQKLLTLDPCTWTITQTRPPSRASSSPPLPPPKPRLAGFSSAALPGHLLPHHNTPDLDEVFSNLFPHIPKDAQEAQVRCLLAAFSGVTSNNDTPA